MLRRLGGCAMIVIALFFLVVIAKGIFTLPRTQEQLKEAAFIEDGVVRPENEGRLVIVLSTLEAAENARDDELGLTLPSPIAIRYVEKFVVRDDGEDWVKAWDPIDEFSTDWLKRRPLFGRASLGDFEVAEELLRSFPCGRELSPSLLDPEELATLEDYVDALTVNGVFYLSEAPQACFTDGRASELYFDYEGLRRVHYRYLDLQPGDTFAVVGLQKGNRLVKDPDLDTNPVFTSARSRSDVIRQNSLFTILGMALVGIVCILLIVFGIRRVIE